MEATNHEYYVSLEVAKLLKEAGFDWPVMHFYDEFEDGIIPFYSRGAEELQQNMNAFGYYSAPTLDVAQRWLREVKGYYVDVAFRNLTLDYRPRIHKMVKGTSYMIYLGNIISSYESAQEAGIKKALEVILEKGE